jgi:hypothetical protein
VIDASEVADVLAECDAAMQSNALGFVARASMLRAEESTENLVSCGCDDSQARERLGRLHAVLEWAHAHGAGVAWA